MTSKTPVRSAEDVDEKALSYAEIKALAAGNPLIIEKTQLDTDVSKLKLLKQSYLSEIYRLEDMIAKYYPNRIKELEKEITNIEKDINLINEWLKYNDFETACKNYLDCNYINFDDVDRIEKINTSIKVHNDKKEQERKQKELERIEQQKAEQQRKIDQVNKDIKENKTVYGSSLQAVIYPAVKDKIKVPLKTLGSLFNIVSVKLDDNFKMEYYRIYKKCKMTDNMVKYFNLIMQEYMQIMEAAA